MKKFYLFLLLPLMIGMSACQSKLTAEEVKELVMEGERDRLPMILQNLPSVDNITVDSLHILVDSEPMSGYLYTTWYDGQKSFSIIVQVIDIKKSEEHKDYIEWKSDWGSAKDTYIQKRYFRF